MSAPEIIGEGTAVTIGVLMGALVFAVGALRWANAVYQGVRDVMSSHTQLEKRHEKDIDDVERDLTREIARLEARLTKQDESLERVQVQMVAVQQQQLQLMTRITEMLEEVKLDIRGIKVRLEFEERIPVS
jgi:gas vesicle protein